MYKHITF